MADWYEVYESDAVLRTVRQQATRLMLVYAPAGAMALALAVVFLTRKPPSPAQAVVALAVVVFALLFFARALHRARQSVWCVKLSDRCIEGYNYARLKTRLDWIRVNRVSFVDGSMMVESESKRSIEIPDRFPDFSKLSHRIVEYAEFYAIPVFVDGRPWEEMDLKSVFPFLEEDELSA